MEDISVKLEKLLSEAEDCDLIVKFATDVKKRELFAKLATDVRGMVSDIEAIIARRAEEGLKAASIADSSGGLEKRNPPVNAPYTGGNRLAASFKSAAQPGAHEQQTKKAKKQDGI
jgi:hypothetical protein